jgi:hypothetical protein
MMIFYSSSYQYDSPKANCHEVCSYLYRLHRIYGIVLREMRELHDTAVLTCYTQRSRHPQGQLCGCVHNL